MQGSRGTALKLSNPPIRTLPQEVWPRICPSWTGRVHGAQIAQWALLPCSGLAVSLGSNSSHPKKALARRLHFLERTKCLRLRGCLEEVSAHGTLQHSLEELREQHMRTRCGALYAACAEAVRLRAAARGAGDGRCAACAAC